MNAVHNEGINTVEGGLLGAALAYARRGMAVFPCYGVRDIGGTPGCTCPKGAQCQNAGKHPRTEHGLNDASKDENVIRSWWRAAPDSNVGVATGKVSGFVALDVDPAHGGDKALADLEAQSGSLTNTVCVRTGSGGIHAYFHRPPAGIRNSASKIGPGIDIRGDGGYVIGSGSAHKSGNAYSYLQGRALGEAAMAPFPEVLLRILQAARPTAGPVNGMADADVILEGGRNAALASIAGTMRTRGTSAAAIEAALLADNAARCRPPLPDDEVRAIAASISRYPAGGAGPVDPEIIIGDVMPDVVADVMRQSKRTLSLFNGEGKAEHDGDGKRLDRSPEGYDFSFLLSLARNGIEDPSMLATALALRPDGYAKARGPGYICAKVKAALKIASAPAWKTPSSGGGGDGSGDGSDGGGEKSAHGVTGVRVYPTEPRRYELQINGDWVAFTTDQLLTPRNFRKRYFEATKTLPDVPRGKGADRKWEPVIAKWMSAAVDVEMPDDGTAEGALQQEVGRILQDLTLGEDLESMDEGRAFVLKDKVEGKDAYEDKGRRLFKTSAIHRQLRTLGDPPKREDITRALYAHGLEYKTYRITVKEKRDGKETETPKVVRAWSVTITRKEGSSTTTPPSPTGATNSTAPVSPQGTTDAAVEPPWMPPGVRPSPTQSDAAELRHALDPNDAGDFSEGDAR